ncbi:hypothetical protein BH09SUM1_BH09SUM1_21340 [soil metagenome]
MKKFAFALLAAAILTAPVVALAGASGYTVAAGVPVPGDGGWDLLAVDSATHRLYLSHSDHVDVIDTEAGKVVGKIEGTEGAHGIAIAPDLSRGFTTNGKSNTVTIFDTKTLKTIERVDVGTKPDAILFDAFSKRVFVMNAGSGDCTVLDPATGKSLGTVTFGKGPELPATDGKGTIYVNIEDTAEVVAFDAANLTILHRWNLVGGEGPTGLAMDAKTHRLFAACHNKKLVVLNSDNGEVVTTVDIGERVDGAAFDPTRNMIFSSNGDGTTTIIHEDSADKYTVVENIATKKGARTIAIDDATGQLYLPAAEYGATPAATTDQPRPRASVVPGSFQYIRIDPPKNKEAAAPAPANSMKKAEAKTP